MSIRQLVGDCRVQLRNLPADSVQAVITSPPYYGLRDYGTEQLVWGGDPDHAHEWGPSLLKSNGGGQPSEKVRWQHTGAGPVGHPKVVAGAGCTCGAWLGSLGLEPTPDMFIEHLVDVFREVRRVLRPDGVVWANLGDSYAGSGKGPSNSLQPDASQLNKGKRNTAQFASGQAPTRWVSVPQGIKPKDLLMMPARLAMALQADGWYLRSQIPWLKRNSMPESVTDRPATSVEYVYLLSKSRTYFWDADAVRVSGAEPDRMRKHERIGGANGHVVRHGVQGEVNGTLASRSRRNSDWFFESWQGLMLDEQDDPLALVVNPAPFSGAHFATFPPKLIEPMIKASTSERGCCPECGALWVRVTERASAPRIQTRRQQHLTAEQVTRTGGMRNGGTNSTTFGLAAHEMPSVITTGWRPTCKHYDDLYRRDFPQARSVRKRGQRAISGDWWKRTRRKPGKDNWPTRPATVLDCFGGAGTVGLVADRLGRDTILIDLKADYADMAQGRLTNDAPMFVDVEMGA